MSKKILVIGEVCYDTFVYGDVERLNPEAPCPILDIGRTIKTSKTNSGMAYNVFKNIQSLSNRDTKVDISQTNKTVENKLRYIDKKSGHTLLRVDSILQEGRIGERPTNEVEYKDYEGPSSSVQNIIGLIKQNDYDLVVISDYNKGSISDSDIDSIAKICKNKEIPTFLDTKKIIAPRYVESVFCLKVNKAEHYALYKNDYAIVDAPRHYIYTNGGDGCCWFQRGIGMDTIPTKNSEVSCVSGAGDTVLAALAVGYLETGDMKKAIEFSMAAASVAVKHRGVVAVKRSEVDSL